MAMATDDGGLMVEATVAEVWGPSTREKDTIAPRSRAPESSAPNELHHIGHDVVQQPLPHRP
eukprot:5417047-Alexandrium_andersonii.AAC.1